MTYIVQPINGSMDRRRIGWAWESGVMNSLMRLVRLEDGSVSPEFGAILAIVVMVLVVGIDKVGAILMAVFEILLN